MIQTLLQIPIVGIVIIWQFAKKPQEIYVTAQGVAILNFIEAQIMYENLEQKTGEFQYQVFALGVDGISMLMIWLTTQIVAITLLSSWKTITVQIKTMVILILAIEVLTIGVFVVLDVLLFYICFESVQIPLFIMIGIYGGRARKIQAAYELFLYTVFGSLIMFIAVLILYLETGTTDYQVMLTVPISTSRQYFLWAAFFISFAIKIPMVPFHIWLPEAHTEAPTAGSVLLAGQIQKLGSYGFLRFSLPLFPDASVYFRPLVFTLAQIGILYSSLACLAQVDIKKVIAYSSIGHMNTSILGIFSNDIHGITGSIYFMVSHGLVSSALFLLIGVLYDRYHTRTIFYYRGLAMTMPVFTIFFFIFSLANIALPSTSAFISEQFTFLGAFPGNPFQTQFATTAIILGPCYSLWFYHQIAYGASSNFLPQHFLDLSLKEFHMQLPLLVFTFLLGLFPHFLFSPIIVPSLTLLV